MSSNSPASPPQDGALGWACPRCTFMNTIDSFQCDVCETERPVEVDIDSPAVAAAPVAASGETPPRGCTKERERGDSPDAVSPSAVAADPAVTPSRQCGEKSDRVGSPDVVRKRERVDLPDVVDPAVAVAADSAVTPPHGSGKKREREDSPDVVELCDSTSAEGKAPPAKKEKLQTHLDKKTFKIMTYNVWFREDLELSSRMNAIGNLIKQHSPDLLCFQEVTPYIYMLLRTSDWWQEYKCLLSQEKAIERPYYCMQLSKLEVKSSKSIPFSNSIMGRELCVADIQIGEKMNLVVATTHLESPCPGPPKWDQMYRKERSTQANKSLEILGCYRNAILCGDTNWDDKGDGPFPMPDGWIDAWVELKPGDDGWTYDTKANGMLSGNRKMQRRLDRFVCKLEDFKIDNIEMIGTEAIPGVSYSKEKKVRKETRKVELPVFPSDHFGLILTVTKLENDKL